MKELSSKKSHLSLHELVEKWQCESRESYKVGLRIGFSAVANQFVGMLRQLVLYKKINVVALVKQTEYEQQYSWYQSVFHDLPLAVYQPENHTDLSYFDLFICPESVYDTYHDLPSSIVKLGCPHGVDIPLKKTISEYGGGFCFDYVLSAIKQPKLPPNQFCYSFPSMLRHHNRPYVTEIPFGFPKLDNFIERVQVLKQKKRAIIYHLSYLPIEQSWVIDFIQPVLRELLENFTTYDIIFRPHHLDSKSVWVEQAKILGQKYSNFVYSDADSYVDDYARGAVMICHRPYELHLFGLATGNKSIICHPINKAFRNINNEQFVQCSLPGLVSCIQQSIKNTHSNELADIVELCEKQGIYHPGRSVEYLVDNIPNIISDKHNEDWHKFILSKEPVNLVRETALNLLSAKPCNIAFQALIGVYGNWPLAKLFAADSYSRVTALHFYCYRIGLELFWQMMHTRALDESEQKLTDYWWRATGAEMLKVVQKQVEGDKADLTQPEVWLQKNMPRQFDINEPSVQSKVQIFNLDSMLYQDLAGRVIIYGAGEVAQTLIQEFEHRPDIDIIAIVDSSFEQQGRKLSGIDVRSPLDLDKLGEANVVIASYAFVHEIYHYVKSELAFTGLVYGLSQDLLIRGMIDLLIVQCSNNEVYPQYFLR